jgi:hypothetical protein
LSATIACGVSLPGRVPAVWSRGKRTISSCGSVCAALVGVELALPFGEAVGIGDAMSKVAKLRSVRGRSTSLGDRDGVGALGPPVTNSP